MVAGFRRIRVKARAARFGLGGCRRIDGELSADLSRSVQLACLAVLYIIVIVTFRVTACAALRDYGIGYSSSTLSLVHADDAGGVFFEEATRTPSDASYRTPCRHHWRKSRFARSNTDFRGTAVYSSTGIGHATVDGIGVSLLHDAQPVRQRVYLRTPQLQYRPYIKKLGYWPRIHFLFEKGYVPH